MSRTTGHGGDRATGGRDGGTRGTGRAPGAGRAPGTGGADGGDTLILRAVPAPAPAGTRRTGGDGGGHGEGGTAPLPARRGAARSAPDSMGATRTAVPDRDGATRTAEPDGDAVTRAAVPHGDGPADTTLTLRVVLAPEPGPARPPVPRPRARKTAPHPDGRQGDTLALRLVPAPEPDRSPAVAELAHELADRIAPAVHAYEVAAVLESEGLTGERIRQRYGHPNLFSLAAELYRLVPRTYPEPPVPADPWRPDHVRCALRGALFALPGLAFPLTAPLWEADGRSVPGLVAAALVSWAWGQAVGHRAYLRLATGRREAGRALLTGAPLGAVLASLAALLVAGPGPAALIAVGQSVYLAAAGVLLVLGRERVLLASLGPLAAGAVALPWWDPGPLLRTGLPLLTVAAATGAAGWAVRGTLREPAVPGDVPPGYLGSLPYGLFGLAAGVLVLCAGQDRPYAVVALTLSMGPAEWLLYRFRGLAVRALLASSSARGFTLRCARALGLCLGGYLLPLLPAALLTGTDPGALVALGATLWTALLLQAFGIAWPPALAALAAACGTALAALTGRPPGPLLPVICCTAAAGVLVVLVLRRLGSPAAHA